MKILIVHEVDWENKVIFEPHHLAELFSVNGHDVYVIECKEPNIRQFFSGLKTKIRNDFWRVYPTSKVCVISPPTLLIKGLNRLSNFFTCKKIIKKTIQEKKIDIVLLYGVATNGTQTIEIANEFNVPVVFRVLDIAHKLVNIPFVQGVVQRKEKYVLTHVDKVLTTTPDLRRYSLKMGSKNEITETFLLGVNLNQFSPKNIDSNLLASFGFSSDDKIFAFMGTLYDFAGLDDIIINFELITKKIPTAKFLIIGGGSHESHLRTLIKKHHRENSIKITGFVNQNKIANYLSLASLCVNPFKINEITKNILPTKILEYFACQKPVLSTPLKGTVELLPTENFGIVYASSENFIQKIIDLFLDEEKLNDLSLSGYSYVTTNHDWNKLTKKLLDSFEEILKNFPKRYM